MASVCVDRRVEAPGDSPRASPMDNCDCLEARYSRARAHQGAARLHFCRRFFLAFCAEVDNSHSELQLFLGPALDKQAVYTVNREQNSFRAAGAFSDDLPLNLVVTVFLKM